MRRRLANNVRNIIKIFVYDIKRTIAILPDDDVEETFQFFQTLEIDRLIDEDE